MFKFFRTPAGMAVFAVAAAVILLVIIEVNYKYFTKRLLDFIFALISSAVCSPLLIVCAVISKIRANSVLEATPYLGGKGKIIYLHAFSGVESRVRYAARLFDVLSGGLSFVGVKPLPVEDGALMDDGVMERFTAKPGIISHLALTGSGGLTYEEMFGLDIRYAKKRGFFYDIWVAVIRLVTFIRGDGKSFLGETASAGYVETLLSRGELTADEAATAREYAQEAVKNDMAAKEFRKLRYR